MNYPYYIMLRYFVDFIFLENAIAFTSILNFCYSYTL